MASCKFEGGKSHGGTEASSYLRHNEITPENRKRVLEVKQKNGEECHIDPTKSCLNKSLTGYTYEQAFARYKDRVRELDAAPGAINKRKDRVTMQAIEVPAPADLPRDKYNQFFQRVADIMKAMYGDKNLVDAVVHWDEEHEYIDSETHEKRMSRVHAHYDFVPEVDGKLNAKQFSKRSNINKLNQAVERMCVTEFDCHFHTGDKKRSKKTVKELKDESKQLQEQADKQAELERLQKQINNIQQDITDKTLELDDLQDKLQSLDDREQDLDTRENDLNNRETSLKLREKALEQQQQKFTSERQKWQEKANTALQAIDTIKVGYDQAKTSYELAAIQVDGIAQGFTANDINSFCNNLSKNLQKKCNAVRYPDGRTLWTFAGRTIMQSLQEAVREEAQNTPDVKLEAQKKRVERAETLVRKLPDISGLQQNTDDYGLSK